MWVDRDFFVSFTAADRPWAEWLVGELDAAGYSSVSQLRDFVAGGNFMLAMDAAARRARRTLGVLSSKALKAPFVRQEWAHRLAADPTGGQRALVLVRVEPCQPEGLLGPVVYIDLVDLDEAAARARLREELAAVVHGLRLAPEAPPFPGGPPLVADVERPRFPTVLPPVWNVPFRRNPEFADREQVLAHLAEQLGRGAATAVTQALQGGGGVGKTALAAEYAYRHRSRFDTVWWVRAEEPATLVSDYAALADALRLPEAKQADQQLTAGAVRRWLDTNDRWLLILDNAAPPTSATGLEPPLAHLLDLVPQVLHGQVLVTSRDASWENHAALAELEVFTSQDAIAFLLARSGSSDQAAAKQVAELLGFLPLALEQAGAYVRETRLALAAYLDRLRHFPALTMAKGRPRDRDPADTVASTFQVSIEQVRPVPGALAMLELCAFLDPGEIPRDLVAQRLDPPAEELAVFVTDPFALDEAVAVVRRFGLVKVTEQALSVHPLLQQALRDHLDSAATAERVGVCIQLLGAAFPSEDFWSAETWPVCERLLPHALAAAVHAERGAIKAAETGHLLGLAASYLHARGRFLDALDLRQRALATTEMVFGVDDIRTAAQLNELAATLLELQRLDEALDRRQRALRLLEQRLGADHPDVAQTLARMGLVLYRRGDYGPAQQVYERAWRIFKQQLGPDHPRTARALTSLGMVFKSTGRLQQAEEVMQEALQILEQQGADRLEVASALDNLGTTLAAMGRLYEARDALETARGIFEDHLGPDHLEVAWSWNHLGDVHFRLGALEAARTAYDRALTIRAALLPADHPDVAKSRAGHDAVLRQLAQRNRQSQEPEPW